MPALIVHFLASGPQGKKIERGERRREEREEEGEGKGRGRRGGTYLVSNKKLDDIGIGGISLNLTEPRGQVSEGVTSCHIVC